MGRGYSGPEEGPLRGRARSPNAEAPYFFWGLTWDMFTSSPAPGAPPKVPFCHNPKFGNWGLCGHSPLLPCENSSSAPCNVSPSARRLRASACLLHCQQESAMTFPRVSAPTPLTAFLFVVRNQTEPGRPTAGRETPGWGAGGGGSRDEL